VLVTAEFAGAYTRVAVNVCVDVASPAAADVALSVVTTGIPTLGTAGVVVPATVVIVSATAFAETTESIPKPNEATATSATRLKVVFVDICFLSFSRDRESPDLGFG
jgi:hypothetical protein